MREELERIIGRLNSLLESDGSRLSVVEMKGDALTIRFEQGPDGPCEQCVMDTGTLEMLVREAVANQLPAIGKVTLLAD